jgi:NADH-quinone oxidoreductase subunit N
MIPMLSLRYWLPVLILTGVLMIELLLDSMSRSAKDPSGRAARFSIALIGLVFAAFVCPLPGAAVHFGREMMIWDALAFVTCWIAFFAAFFVVLLSERNVVVSQERTGPYYSLLLMATAGLYFLGTANDLIMVFLAMELVGIPLFVLTGYSVGRQKSVEAATKFFLVAVFSSGMLVYGISLIYGALGSTSLSIVTDPALLTGHSGILLSMGLTLVLIALGYKVGLAPFHLWVPDAFTGAPTPVAAYLSVAPKVAGLIVLARVFGPAIQAHSFSLSWTLAPLAALTIFIGTLVGLRQTNVVRLLAYSSIAHMGYMLLGVLAGTSEGMAATYLYGGAYLFMNMGAFALVAVIVNKTGSSELDAFRGLSKKAPLVAALLLLFLLSLAGFPPLAGFVSKFYVLSSAFHAGWKLLVVWAALNAVIGAAYYFKIVRAMYLQTSDEVLVIELNFQERLVLAATSFFTLAIGLAPQIFLDRLHTLLMK